MTGIQRVNGNPDGFSKAPGDILTIDVMYRCQNTHLVGLGLELFYDDTQLEFQSISNVLQYAAMGQQDSADSLDADSRPKTTRYINTAWADFNGRWPGTSPVHLYTVKFLCKPGFAGTVLDFKPTSSPAGYTLEAQPISITKT